MEQIPTVKEADTQFAKSMTSDFEEGTWTFLMPKKFQVWAGDFAIVDKQVYDKMIQRLTLCEGKEKEIAELKENNSKTIVRDEVIKTFENMTAKLNAQSQRISELEAENDGNKEIARARGEAINELQEQYAIMDGRRERAIKSLEESEKQFEQLQEAYNKLIGS